MCLDALRNGSYGWEEMGRVIHAAGHLAVGLYAFSTIFLVMKFHRHWDAFTLQFLHETNKEEAQSFLSAFLFDWHTLALLLGTAVFFFAEGWLQRRVAQLPLFPKSRWKKVALAGAVAVVGVNALFFSTDADRNYDLAAKLHTPVKRNALWNLWQSHLKYGEFKKEFERCADVQKQYRERPSCQEREADVVLIIGESFNKHFSNLYDGKYNTNPLLAKRLEEGEGPAGTEKGKLFVFNDVISSDNGTTQNFKYFLSMASVATRKKGISWCDQPLFPTILRSCGFNVVYFSNQFAPNDNLGQWDASMGFVNHPGIELISSTTATTKNLPTTLNSSTISPGNDRRWNAPTAIFVSSISSGSTLIAATAIPKVSPASRQRT